MKKNQGKSRASGKGKSSAKKTLPTQSEASVDVAQVVYNNIKSSHFRVIHVTGCFGGMTPRGEISMDLYSERIPIPKTQTYTLQAETKSVVEDLEKRAGLVDPVREFECGLILDPEVALSIGQWLIEKGRDALEQIERAKEEAANE